MGTKRRIKKSEGYESIEIGMAFGDFMMQKSASNLSEATLTTYEQSFRLFEKTVGLTDDMPTTDITSAHIYKWINTMKLNGLKPSSINHYLRDVRTFLNWCMDSDRNYIEPFKIQQIKGQEEPIKLFSDEDIEKLLVKPRKNDSFAEWRSWAIVNWVLGTGNRASTICEVRIGDIDFRKMEVVLRHTKNKKAQIVPLSTALKTVIKEYIRMWRKDADEEEYLFCNIGAEKLTTNGLRQAFAKYCHDREVQQTNIHGLRHNFAKYWVKNNGDMFTLQKILGHSSLEMTRRYVKLFSEDIKEDFDKYSPLDTIKRKQKRTQVVKRNYE